MLQWSEPSLLCLNVSIKRISFLLIVWLLLLREATEARRRESESTANIGLREAEGTWVLRLLLVSLRSVSSNELLLLPHQLLLHLRVHLLLPEHLLIDHLLLLRSEDVGTHVRPTLKRSTWEKSSEGRHTHACCTWVATER